MGFGDLEQMGSPVAFSVSRLVSPNETYMFCVCSFVGARYCSLMYGLALSVVSVFCLMLQNTKKNSTGFDFHGFMVKLISDR